LAKPVWLEIVGHLLGDIRSITLLSSIMKKHLLTAVALFSALLLRAQSEGHVFKPFKVDVSLGAAVPQGGGAKGGLLLAVEPKYAIVDAFSVGLRIETAIMTRSYSTSDGRYSTDNVSGAGSYVLTGDYYFSTKTIRPFVGAGAGLYMLAAATVDYSGSTGEIASSQKFGGMIRAGFETGHFRMGIEYNFVGNSSYEFVTGSAVASQNSYLGIKLGVCIGGGRLN
jgi:hypothetical protein